MGHLTPFLRLASMLLSHKDCHLTLITGHPTVSDTESSYISYFLSQNPEVNHIQLQIIPFHGSNPTTDDPFFLQFEATRRSAHLLHPLLSSTSPPLSALFSDFVVASTVSPIAADLGIPNYIVATTSAKFFCLIAYLPTLLSNVAELSRIPEVKIPGLTPLQISSVPPPFKDPDHLFTAQLATNALALSAAKGILINTFDGFESETLAAANDGRVLTHLPSFLPTGPLEPYELNKEQMQHWLGIWERKWGWGVEALLDGEEIAERIGELMGNEKLKSNARKVGEEARKASGVDGSSEKSPENALWFVTWKILCDLKLGPHVALLPSSGMGHLTPFIRLAASLTALGVQVTFITPHPTLSLAESESLSHFFSTFAQITRKHLHLLPLDNPSVNTEDPFYYHFEVIRRSSHLLSPILSSLSPPVSALITDMSLASTVIPITDALRLPNYVLFTSSAKMSILFLSFHTMVGTKASGDSNLMKDVQISSLEPIARSWIPPPLLHDDDNLLKSYFIENGKKMTESSGILINTYESIEHESLAALSDGKVVKKLPPVIGLGMWVENWGWGGDEPVVKGEEIAERIKELMGNQLLRSRATLVREEARMAVRADGSSYKKFIDLIETWKTF
ncbi:hypothetical protein FEM48_Zijuj04G0049200 [Ziziphus jujuba var. spinosa]|uniref:Uncharacterized protein n=1 Tax=Ziziphus jujuba var. spinosa TaxID=714518 RepID=A0A978VHX3_ZIZJJ|nr:hypothetical protein FEM48_Zijuj04G0049200 [Ziziphus jujuba var. spinosa]